MLTLIFNKGKLPPLNQYIGVCTVFKNIYHELANYGDKSSICLRSLITTYVNQSRVYMKLELLLVSDIANVNMKH